MARALKRWRTTRQLLSRFLLWRQQSQLARIQTDQKALLAQRAGMISTQIEELDSKVQSIATQINDHKEETKDVQRQMDQAEL